MEGSISGKITVGAKKSSDGILRRANLQKTKSDGNLPHILLSWRQGESYANHRESKQPTIASEF